MDNKAKTVCYPQGKLCRVKSPSDAAKKALETSPVVVTRVRTEKAQGSDESPWARTQKATSNHTCTLHVVYAVLNADHTDVVS